MDEIFKKGFPWNIFGRRHQEIYPKLEENGGRKYPVPKVGTKYSLVNYSVTSNLFVSIHLFNYLRIINESKAHKFWPETYLNHVLYLSLTVFSGWGTP